MSNWKKFKKIFSKPSFRHSGSIKKPVGFSSVDNIFLRTSFANPPFEFSDEEDLSISCDGDATIVNKKDFQKYTINELESLMENILNNDVDLENLKINEIKQMLNNDFSNEYLLGTMTIKKIREKLLNKKLSSEMNNMELNEIVCYLESKYIFIKRYF
jgi:hypothetical protein